VAAVVEVEIAVAVAAVVEEAEVAAAAAEIATAGSSRRRVVSLPRTSGYSERRINLSAIL
jgi:hypothetical protein